MECFRTICFVIIFITLASCNNTKNDKSLKDKTVSVDVIVADNEVFSNVIEVNGTVLSEEMLELHSETNGRITYLNMPDGAKVKEGTILLKINDAELQAKLKQQKIQYDLAVKTEERLKKLLAVNGINQSEYDAAVSQVSLLQANIEELNAQIDKTTIKAPFDGVLGLRQISIGAYISSATVIGSIQQTEKLKIDFTLPETYSNLIEIGNIVFVKADGLSENIPAKITAVEPQVNITNSNIKVRATIQNTNLNPGFFVKVLLDKKSKEIVVPTNAIIPDALSNQVIVVKQGKAKFINVETGTRNANVVEILKGINIGDSVVVSGMLFVRPDTKIKIEKVRNVNDSIF